MQIDIEKVIVKDRIRKDFGDIEELAEDIRQNGLINPPVINKDNVLLAGERRLLACKALGWKEIEVRVMDTRDAEHELNVEISENESRKEFSKAERADYMRRLMRIEQAKAKERQNLGQKSDEGSRADDVTAKQFGISRDTLRKEMEIVEHKDLIPPEDFADWDEGKLSTNKVFRELKSRVAQTDREVKFYKDRIATLEKQKTQTVEVVPEDYEELKEQLRRAKADAKRANDDFWKIREEQKAQNKKIKTLESQIEEDKRVEDVERDMNYFTNSTHEYIRRFGGHVWTFEHFDAASDEAKKAFIKAIKTLDGFAQQLLKNIGGSLNE